MEARGVPAEDVLLQRPWLPVDISGCQLLAKSWFGETAYGVLLTDLHCVWEERMDAAAIQSRAQELNRRLRAPVKAFFSHLCEVVQPFLSGGSSQADGEAQISLTRQEDGNINMRLKSELAGLPFYWQFHCVPAPVTLVCTQLVRPLLVMSRLLQRQVDQLGGLLVRKDAEIQDYRENGATLSRDRLQTEVFEEQTYREDFMTKVLPLLRAEQQEALGFQSDLQQLYAAIVTSGSAPKPPKRKASEEPLAEDPAPKEAALISSPDAKSVHSEVDRDRKQSHDGQVDTSGATRADRTVQQPRHVTPAERQSSKPKKKKVGLFR